MNKFKRPRSMARAERMARVIARLTDTGLKVESCICEGVNPRVAWGWRRRYPDFAEQWGIALARFETCRIAELVGATKVKQTVGKKAQTLFLDTLAGTASVAEAARVVGFTTKAFYQLRRRDTAFCVAWESALAQGYAQLEAILLDRCVNGVEPLAEDRQPMRANTQMQMLRHGSKKSGARQATADDEAERDRNEALAAKWVADFRAEVERLEALNKAGGL